MGRIQYRTPWSIFENIFKSWSHFFLIKNLFGGVGIAKIGLDFPNKFSYLLLFWPMIHVNLVRVVDAIAAPNV